MVSPNSQTLKLEEEKMLNHNPANFHVEYIDVTQHWNAASAQYAGGDCLVTAIYRGWQINPVIYQETKWYAGNRQVSIYHIELTRGDERMVMPIIHNPWIQRQLRQMPYLRIYPIEERDRRQKTVD